MKRLSVLMLALMLALCPIALAEAEPPEGALDIAGSFDATDWSIGDIKWLTPLDDYIQALEFGDEVLLASPEEDAVLSRTQYVSDFGRECRIAHTYEYISDGFKLCQVKISAAVTDDGDLAVLAGDAEAIYRAICERYNETAGDDAGGLGNDQDIVRRLTEPEDVFLRYFWNGNTQIGELNGKPLCGLFSIGYEEVKGERTVFITLGETLKR